MSYPFDAELAAAMGMMPTTDFTDIPAARAHIDRAVATMPSADTAGVTVRDVRIVADEVGGAIMLRITTPDEAPRPIPMIYHLHPGGFCVGNLDLIHPRMVQLAREVGAITVAADYRLAPEHPYPIPLQDSYAGLRWVADNADELGADAERIAVHGYSSGGGLAAAVTLLARDRGAPRIAYQYLNAPEIDDRLETVSARRFTDTPLWSLPNAVLSWKHYLGGAHEAGSDDVPVYAAPARATDFRGLPPTYIAVKQFDPLRDEGITYAQKLLEADVVVELHQFPATFHGSSMIAAAEVSQRELAEEVAVLTRALYS